MRKKKKTTSSNLIVILLMFISLSSFGQNRQDKTIAIIDKLNIVEDQQASFEFQLESIKYRATGNDSIRIIELAKQLSREKITNRIKDVFDEGFSTQEIDDIYNFLQTSAFEKMFNSQEMDKQISSNFRDINDEIEKIRNNLDALIVEPIEKFKPIQVEGKKDGFYAIIDYRFSTEDEDIKLEENPSLTSKDILEVTKTTNNYNNQSQINIVFTKEGSQKLYMLTKQNIGIPIAIVIGSRIISLPTVYSVISEGKVDINGNFSDKEIDEIILKLKKK